jgi:2-(1,2-epoxy-1,2-dihydrophenyl)acetyl-CoA isomerase
MTDMLKFEVRPDKVAIITFNNPEKLNAFSNEMLDGYLDRLAECGERDDVRCVVVTGAGRGFCSGGDTGGMGGAPTTVTAVKSGLWDRIQKISQAIQALDKPVLAAVNGVAVGAGMDLALHADIRYAGKSARFAETYVRMGLVPGNGACWFLPRIVGVQKALELLWTSKFVNADEAKDIGLVMDVYEDDQLMEKVLETATKIAAGAPISVQLIKRLVYQNQTMDLRSSLDMVSSHMTLARMSDDHVEAISAWREKRPANFKGS